LRCATSPPNSRHRQACCARFYSILGLVKPPGRIAGGEIRYRGSDLRQLQPEALRQLRGDRIAMVFQDPGMALNPVLSIGTQIIEAITAHRSISRAAARGEARDMLAQVGIPSAEERLDAYPHQLSGGMRQRVGIAIALINQPDIVIADEPTTALDVTIQSQILHLATELCRKRQAALVWITHDLGVVATIAHRLMVMYAGRVVEAGPVSTVLDRPLHPYTAGLLASAPDAGARGQRLRPIPGMVPPLHTLPVGCSFHPRCDRAVARCAEPLPAIDALRAHWARCVNPIGGEGRA
jgi:peptide/nickel transport system ATP-binding protein